MRRNDILPVLGIDPALKPRVQAILRARIDEAERREGRPLTALDAGCGRRSPLASFRPRLARVVGVDLHEPDPPLPWLDEFAVADLCRPAAPIPGDGFDLVLSNFTVEHFAAPAVALANFRSWLRPRGWLLITTVNRRHPFVDAYLRLPDPIRRRLQPVLKASAADAHPLVGACNTPGAIRAALVEAGFEDVSLETVPNLARAWGRHHATFAIGLAGDLLAQSMPARRSTIIAVGRVPA